MCVGADGHRLRIFRRLLARRSIVPAEDVAAVVALDRLDIAGDALQSGAREDRATKDVEGMGNCRNAALLVDGADGLLGREAARHQLSEEEADDLAFRCLDLLAD